tara:strand:+ start:5945 stop:6235 length:291 start_codon:yes stop_codon:yes gene_type:complete
MEEAVQWMLQGGALAILVYIVVWTTRTGAPGLFDALGGIRGAVEKNTVRTEQTEQTMRELTYAVRRMAEQHGTVGDATMATLRHNEKPRDPPGHVG